MTDADVIVRPASAADAPAIAGLLEQLGYPVSAADVPDRLARMAANHRGAMLVAASGDWVLGVATMHVLTVINRPRDVAWLTALVIDEAVRGRGVGRRLVGEIERLAREAGCERLNVTTHESRLGAREFYRRLGFDATGRRFGKVLAS